MILIVSTIPYLSAPYQCYMIVIDLTQSGDSDIEEDSFPVVPTNQSRNSVCEMVIDLTIDDVCPNDRAPLCCTKTSTTPAPALTQSIKRKRKNQEATSVSIGKVDLFTKSTSSRKMPRGNGQRPIPAMASQIDAQVHLTASITTLIIIIII